MSNHRWLVTYSVVRGSEHMFKTRIKNTAYKVLTIELDVFKGRKKGIRWSKPYKQCSLSSFNLLHFFPRPVHPRREATALLVQLHTPGITATWLARGAAHPGHHGRGRGPRCGVHGEAPGGPHPPRARASVLLTSARKRG